MLPVSVKDLVPAEPVSLSGVNLFYHYCLLHFACEVRVSETSSVLRAIDFVRMAV